MTGFAPGTLLSLQYGYSAAARVDPTGLIGLTRELFHGDLLLGDLW